MDMGRKAFTELFKLFSLMNIKSEHDPFTSLPTIPSHLTNKSPLSC
jgi:hypothetical protein